MSVKARTVAGGVHELQVSCEPWSEALRRRFIEERCSGILIGCPGRGPAIADLDFVRSLPGLSSIRLLHGVADYSAVADVPGLEYLQFNSRARQPVDLAALTRLRRLEMPFAVGSSSLPVLTGLEELIVTDWPGGDFTALGPKPALKWLRVELSARATVTSAGLKDAPVLTRLSLYAGRLDDTAEIASLTRLTWLEIHGTKVQNLSFVASLPHLETLEIHDGGNVETLQSIAGHPQLATVILSGSTSLVDGDLQPLWRAPALRAIALAHKRHYNRTRTDVDAPFPLPH